VDGPKPRGANLLLEGLQEPVRIFLLQLGKQRLKRVDLLGDEAGDPVQRALEFRVSAEVPAHAVASDHRRGGARELLR
jgi:hypothetical protein